MITILSSILGFFSAALPEFLKLFQDRADRKHELAIMDRQLEMRQQGHSERLEEIHAQADIAEAQAIYKTYHTGIPWVDALNGTVRPVLAYAFFFLYALVKLALWDHCTTKLSCQDVLWQVEDQAIFASIISFYFGQRAMRKLRHAG